MLSRSFLIACIDCSCFLKRNFFHPDRACYLATRLPVESGTIAMSPDPFLVSRVPDNNGLVKLAYQTCVELSRNDLDMIKFLWEEIAAEA